MATHGWKIVNLIYTVITLIAIIAFVVLLHVQKLQFERGFKLIFAALILGFLCKTVYCAIDLNIHWGKYR